MNPVPSLSQIKALIGGGFWDVTSVGMPAEFQISIWITMIMVAMSAANIAGVVPLMPVSPRGSSPLSIVMAPIQHGSPLHLLGNVFGLLFMTHILSVVKPDFWPHFAVITLTSGAIYWSIGPRGGGAIGASDAIFGIWAYFIAWKAQQYDSGFLIYIGLAFAIFGVSIYRAFFPNNPSRISHLIGVAVGVVVALYAT